MRLNQKELTIIDSRVDEINNILDFDISDNMRYHIKNELDYYVRILKKSHLISLMEEKGFKVIK